MQGASRVITQDNLIDDQSVQRVHAAVSQIGGRSSIDEMRVDQVTLNNVTNVTDNSVSTPMGINHPTYVNDSQSDTFDR